MNSRQGLRRDDCHTLAYAKDLAVADRIEVENILEKAAQFEQFLIGKMPEVAPSVEQKAQEVERSLEDVQQSKPQLTPGQKKVIATIALTVKDAGLSVEEGKQGLVSFAENNLWGNVDDVTERGLVACTQKQLDLFLKHLQEEGIEPDIPY